jgi:hypothetical protein
VIPLSIQTRTELKKLGIEFAKLSMTPEHRSELWPTLILPSGTMLVIGRDEEGNGPGSIHEYLKDEGEDNGERSGSED